MAPLMQLKGGIPLIVQGTTGVATVEEWKFEGGYSNWMRLENRSETNDLLLSFTREDADAGVGITIPAGIGAPGNPFEAFVECSHFFTSAAAAVPFSALMLLRRG